MNRDEQAGLDLLGGLLQESDVVLYETDTKIEVSSWQMGFKLVLTTSRMTISNVLCGHRSGVNMRIIDIKTDGIAYSGGVSDTEIAYSIESLLHTHKTNSRKKSSIDACAKLEETLGYKL